MKKLIVPFVCLLWIHSFSCGSTTLSQSETGQSKELVSDGGKVSKPETAHENASPSLPEVADQQTFEQAKKRATELGKSWFSVVQALAKDIKNRTGSDNGHRKLCLALSDKFGKTLGKVKGQDGRLTIGGAFRYKPDKCNNLQDAVSLDGRPALVIGSWRGTVGSTLFYEFTIVDLSTGFLYQGCGGVSLGCRTSAIEWYGAYQPDVNARIMGNFSRKQLDELAKKATSSFDSAQSP